MGQDVWEALPEVKDMVKGLVAEYHPDLAMILEDIAIIFKTKAAKSGGVVIPGKAKKAPSVIEILGKRPFIFILEIGGDEWMTFSNSQRLALLDHLLCACRVKVDEDTGETKYFIAPPDFSYFRDEIIRHGVWQNLDETDELASDKAATKLEENFGGVIVTTSAHKEMSQDDE